RAGSTTTMWFDGASCGTTNLIPANLDSQVISIMGQQDTSNLRVDGYMSEVRVYRGSLYSGATISIPSAPYPNGVVDAECGDRAVQCNKLSRPTAREVKHDLAFVREIYRRTHLQLGRAHGGG
ncbi:MAG: hypothetical protein RL442_2540, partial [Pseudomonadota bacterium]